MSAPYGVIFDMDGVLVDSYGPHFESWRMTSRKRGYDLTEATFRRLFGRTNRTIIPAITGRELPLEEMDAWGIEKEEIYRAILARRFPLMSGASEILTALRADGGKLALGSSGPPENVALLLERMPGGFAFDAVVTGRDVRNGKPDPEVFLRSAGKMGLSPRDCAVVEDSLAGLEAARRAGAAAIALEGTVPPGELEASANLIVSTLRELSPARIRELIARRRR